MAARTTHYAESNAESTTALTTPQVKTTLTFTPDDSSDYVIMWRASGCHTSTGGDFRADLYNGTTTLANLNVEPKDTTDYFTVAGLVKESYGVSPGSKTYDIRYSAETATAKIKDARVWAMKLGANDRFSASTAESTTTSATPASKVTDTFTPGTTQKYVIIASAEMKNNNGGGQWQCGLDIDGTDYCLHTFDVNEVTEWRSWFGVKKISLDTSSHTIAVEYARIAAGTVSIRNANLWIFPEFGFDNNYSAEQFTRQTKTGNSSYADVVTLTDTPLNLKHLVLACSQFDGTVATSSYGNKLVIAGVDDSITEIETNLAGNEMTYATFYEATLAASSTTWAIAHRTEASAQTVGTDDASIIVLQIEETPSGPAPLGMTASRRIIN